MIDAIFNEQSILFLIFSGKYEMLSNFPVVANFSFSVIEKYENFINESLCLLRFVLGVRKLFHAKCFGYSSIIMQDSSTNMCKSDTKGGINYEKCTVYIEKRFKIHHRGS